MLTWSDLKRLLRKILRYKRFTDISLIPYGKKFCREEIFAEGIFAEFNFVVLNVNQETKEDSI